VGSFHAKTRQHVGGPACQRPSSNSGVDNSARLRVPPPCRAPSMRMAESASLVAVVELVTGEASRCGRVGRTTCPRKGDSRSGGPAPALLLIAGQGLRAGDRRWTAAGVTWKGPLPSCRHQRRMVDLRTVGRGRRHRPAHCQDREGVLTLFARKRGMPCKEWHVMDELKWRPCSTWWRCREAIARGCRTVRQRTCPHRTATAERRSPPLALRDAF